MFALCLKSWYNRSEVICVNVVIAIDSFKGSLTSLEAGYAVKEAIMKLDAEAEVFVRPLADGGEGTVAALSALADAEIVEVTVAGPLMDTVKAKYCIVHNRKLAIIEIAEAAGHHLLPKEQLDPMRTTTFGVGQIIADAIEKGCRNFLIGLGGSATNDGGAGMLQALGYSLLDKCGKAIVKGARGLEDLHYVSDVNALPQLKECKFRVACDVKNPLCGDDGCSSVFAPQKGATPESIYQMDDWLSRFAYLTREIEPAADPDMPGAGAAGGLGFAFASFLKGTLEPGIDIVLQETNLESYIAEADIVVTGEGRLDRQTVMGKAPVGVAKLAKQYGKPVIAFAGCATQDAEVCNAHGIDAFFPILRQPTTLQEAVDPKNAYQNLKDTAYQVFRLLYLQAKDDEQA